MKKVLPLIIGDKIDRICDYQLSMFIVDTTSKNGIYFCRSFPMSFKLIK